MEKSEKPSVTEKQLEECAEGRFYGDYSKAYKELGVSPEDIILNKSIVSLESKSNEAAPVLSVESAGKNGDVGKATNLEKALAWYAHASKLDGLVYKIESTGYVLDKNGNKVYYTEEQLKDFNDRSTRLKKMGKYAALSSLGLNVLDNMGYPSKAKTKEDEQKIADRLYGEITGPDKDNKNRLARMRRQIKKIKTAAR